MFVPNKSQLCILTVNTALIEGRVIKIQSLKSFHKFKTSTWSHEQKINSSAFAFLNSAIVTLRSQIFTELIFENKILESFDKLVNREKKFRELRWVFFFLSLLSIKFLTLRKTLAKPFCPLNLNVVAMQ